MKNDIKQIKNELQEEKSKVKTQNQIKKRQERLKNNLYEVISEMLETGKTYLYVLEEKHEVIIQAIKRTNNEETKEESTNEWADFDFLPGTYKKVLEEKQKENETQESSDYNFLYKEFFIIYSRIEREEKKKRKLLEEQQNDKMLQICINKIEFDLEECERRTGKNKAEFVACSKYLEVKEQTLKEIMEDFPEFDITKLSKAYDKARKQIDAKYKYTLQEEQQEEPQSKDVKLHWVWKANIIVDALNYLIKHF